MKDFANSWCQKSWEFYSNQHAKALTRIAEYKEKVARPGASDEFISAINRCISREEHAALRCEEKFPQLKEKKQ